MIAMSDLVCPGANLDIEDKGGKTALNWALDLRLPQIAEALRKAGECMLHLRLLFSQKPLVKATYDTASLY